MCSASRATLPHNPGAVWGGRYLAAPDTAEERRVRGVANSGQSERQADPTSGEALRDLPVYMTEPGRPRAGRWRTRPGRHGRSDCVTTAAGGTVTDGTKTAADGTTESCPGSRTGRAGVL